jgi:hypothetical protein
MNDDFFKRVYASDMGRGYLAIDVLAAVCYLSLLLYTGFILWFSFSFASKMSLMGLIYIPVSAIAVYVVRLLVRSVFAWRDKTADELIDNSDRG